MKHIFVISNYYSYRKSLSSNRKFHTHEETKLINDENSKIRD